MGYQEDEIVWDIPASQPNVPVTKNPFTAAQSTEKLISQRPSFIKKRLAASSEFVTQHPFKTALMDVGAGLEAIESVPTNIGLGIQQRRGVKQTFQDVIQGVRGERPSELGDIARASGLPGISHPAVASTTGLLTSGGLGLTTKLGRKAAGTLSRGLTAPARNVARTATTSGRASFTNTIRQTVYQARRQLGEKFGNSIDAAVLKNPTGQVDLQQAATQLQQHLASNPGLRSQLQAGSRKAGSDLVLLIADDPTLAKNVTLQDAQLIKRALGAAPEVTQAIRKRGLSTGAGQQLSEVRDMVRRAELDVFPELSSTFKEFKEGMDMYRMVQPYLAPGKLSPQIFGQSSELLGEAEKRLSFKELLGRGRGKTAVGGTSNPFSDVLGVARTSATRRGVGRSAGYVGAAGAGAALYSLFGRKLSGSTPSLEQ